MYLGGRNVPCTYCPTPCQECRAGGRGAYCEHTPCDCDCHKDLKGYGARKAEQLVIKTEGKVGADPPAHPLKVDRSARRSDTAHPGSDYRWVWGESLNDIRDKARDKLLLELGQAMLLLMYKEAVGNRESLARAVQEFQKAIE